MMPTAPVFHANPVLFGHDSTPRLLAFELEGDDRIRTFSRGEDGQVVSSLQEFHPFLLLAGTDLLAGWGGGYEIEAL